MRFNVKKVTIVVGFVVFLWLMLTYGSVIEVPRSASKKNPAIEIENRITRLQKQMDEQIADSNKLLEKVKKHLKKAVVSHEREEDESAKDLEVLQSKFHIFFINVEN